MKFYAIGGCTCSPEGVTIEDAHLGVSYDYRVAGKRTGEMVELLLSTRVYDYLGNAYARKGKFLVQRQLVVTCVETMIREHLLLLGVDPVQARGLLRDFAFDKKKIVPFNWREFDR